MADDLMRNQTISRFGLDLPQEPLRILQLGEKFLLGAKFGRVHTTAPGADFYRMLQMQHFMIDDVLHGMARNCEMVKDAADDDRVVRRIIMAQHVPGSVLAPAHARPPKQSVEESCIQAVENHM